MSPWSTQIVKDRTADGWFWILPNAPFKLGDELQVDLDSRRVEERARPSNPSQRWKGEVIDVIDPTNIHGPQMFFPCEMLDL